MNKLILSFILTVFALVVKGQSVTASPNPCLQRTLVSYSLPLSDTISLKVYDLTGKEIIILKSTQYLNAGSYNDSLKLDAFNPGIYMVYLKTQNQMQIVAKVVKTGVTSIPVVARPAQTNVFPNPATQTLNIEFETSQLGSQVTLYNSLGQVVYTEKINASKSSIDLYPYAKGLYTLFVVNPTGSKAFKIVKE